MDRRLFLPYRERGRESKWSISCDKLETLYNKLNPCKFTHHGSAVVAQGSFYPFRKLALITCDHVIDNEILATIICLLSQPQCIKAWSVITRDANKFDYFKVQDLHWAYRERTKMYLNFCNELWWWKIPRWCCRKLLKCWALVERIAFIRFWAGCEA